MELFQRLHFLCTVKQKKREEEDEKHVRWGKRKFRIHQKKKMLRVNER